MQALESVEEQADKMASLVSALLSVTRAEQGLNRFTLEKANLSELVNEVCDKFKSSKSIKLITDIDNNVVINMNTPLMVQLLENLLSNAEKYGKENGVINVKLYSEKDKTVLSVRDNGIGISEADLPKIWNRFYRADTSRSETEGFGLGLALVKRIIDIVDGEISVKSTFGEGSEFSVKLKLLPISIILFATANE